MEKFAIEGGAVLNDANLRLQDRLGCNRVHRLGDSKRRHKEFACSLARRGSNDRQHRLCIPLVFESAWRQPELSPMPRVWHQLSFNAVVRLEGLSQHDDPKSRYCQVPSSSGEAANMHQKFDNWRC